jgi:O-antigen/teichoic acid export membrane protein
MTDLKRASIRGVAWNLAQNLVGRLLGLAVVAVLSRLLAREAFGEVAIALAVITVGDQLVGLGYAEFITQREDLTAEHLDTAFWLNLLLGGIVTLVIAATAPIIATEFDSPQIAPIVRWLSLNVAIRSLTVVPTQLLSRRFEFRTLSVRSLIAIAVGGAAGIVGALAGMGVFAIVLQIIVADIASALILWRATEWRPRWRFDTKCVGQLTRFGGPVLAATLLNVVSRRIDALIVGGALDMDRLGTYSMAQRPFQVANQVLNKSGDAVALAALSRLADDPDRRRAAVYRAVELTAALCFPLYALLALTASPLIVVLFGAKWVDSSPVLVIFAISGLPISLSYLHASAIKSSGQTRLYLFIHIVLVAVYLPTVFVLVQRGPAAAAAAYLISCLVIMPVEIALVRMSLEIRIKDYVVSLVGPSLATAAMCAVMLVVVSPLLVTLPAIGQLVMGGIAGLAVYVLALRVMAKGTYNLCVNVVRSAIDRPLAKT